jgi:hypothetical protein
MSENTNQNQATYNLRGIIFGAAVVALGFIFVAVTSNGNLLYYNLGKIGGSFLSGVLIVFFASLLVKKLRPYRITTGLALGLALFFSSHWKDTTFFNNLNEFSDEWSSAQTVDEKYDLAEQWNEDSSNVVIRAAARVRDVIDQELARTYPGLLGYSNNPVLQSYSLEDIKALRDQYRVGNQAANDLLNNISDDWPNIAEKAAAAMREVYAADSSMSKSNIDTLVSTAKNEMNLRVDHIVNLYEAEEKISEVEVSIFDFLATTYGTWSIDESGMFYFDHQSDADQFNALAEAESEALEAFSQREREMLELQALN